jgi:outer membrane protein
MKVMTALAILTALAASPIYGQEQQTTPPAPRTPLKVDEAVALALAHAPRLQQLDAYRSAAEAGISQARADEKPHIDVSAGYTRYSDVPEFVVSVPGETGGGVLFPNIPNNARARVGASYSLYNGGRTGGLVDAARGERDSAEGLLEAARGDLVLETRRGYWSLVTAEEKVRVLTENLKAFDAHLTDARNRERFGLAAKNEVLAIEVERDRAELNRLRAETSSRLARANLARLLGLPSGESIEPAETLVPLAPSAENADALVAQALENRPEVSALEARVAAAAARVRVEKSAILPQVSLGAGYLVAHPNPRYLPPLPEWNDNWELGVSLGWSVFDGGKASAGEARARAQADAARAELTDIEERIRLEVVGALLDVENAQAEVELSARAVDAARESRRVAAERYRQGVILSSELLDAEVALLRADLDRTAALASSRLAAAALDRAVSR